MIILKIIFTIMLIWGFVEIVFYLLRCGIGAVQLWMNKKVEGVEPTLKAKIISTLGFVCAVTFIIFLIVKVQI